MRPATFIAAIRFGLGRQANETLPDDPRGWLLAQLEGAGANPGPGPDLPSDFRGIYRLLQEDNDSQSQGNGRPNQQKIWQGEAQAFLAEGLVTAAPFREKLVHFWANHFTVARGKVPYTVGHLIRTAIRPNVTGRFTDMLLAVNRHPAMITYLDNQGSVGPASRAAARPGAGLNENLAREILELHTLTPRAGYSQADVTSLAKILTGWSHNPRREPFGYVFWHAAHEPGPKKMLGREYPEGEEGGIAALTWLAEHEATQRHLAFKLARHFIADNPPAGAVASLFATLRDTRGDLGAVSRRLVSLPEVWKTPLSKLRTPVEYVLAVLRAMGTPPGAAASLIGLSQFLGQPIWNARAPNGWSDKAADWATPEAMLRRIDWVSGVAARDAGRDAASFGEAIMGPLLRPQTLQAAARAGSARTALTLVLASAEFQRR